MSRGFRHGKHKTRAYRAWINMKTRCYDTNTPYFHKWGGRGITVCERWLKSFQDFHADMGDPPPGFTLDRIDNDKGYSPTNCRWATRKQQSRNVRSNRHVIVAGKTQTLAEAAERAPVPYNTVLYRLKRGWSVEDAVSYEAKKGFRP